MFVTLCVRCEMMLYARFMNFFPSISSPPHGRCPYSKAQRSDLNIEVSTLS
jgi:hypothetical protein